MKLNVIKTTFIYGMQYIYIGRSIMGLFSFLFVLQERTHFKIFHTKIIFKADIKHLIKYNHRITYLKNLGLEMCDCHCTYNDPASE